MPNTPTDTPAPLPFAVPIGEVNTLGGAIELTRLITASSAGTTWMFTHARTLDEATSAYLKVFQASYAAIQGVRQGEA